MARKKKGNKIDDTIISYLDKNFLVQQWELKEHVTKTAGCKRSAFYARLKKLVECEKY